MKKAFLTILMLLVVTHFTFAEETFYTSLESQESVEAEGGTVDGGEFAEGAFGNGFKSMDPKDVITFPVEDRFTNLEEGTVELFVTMGIDASEISGELFMFITYKRGTDALDLSWNNNVARARIKSAGSWYTAASDPLDWKEGETHHMAHTWGPAGLHLYLDGEQIDRVDFEGGPTLLSTWMAINNVEPANANFPSQSVVDEVRIFDHQKEVDELILDPEAPFPVEPGQKFVATWAKIKENY
jgi:hypothetical protein